MERHLEVMKNKMYVLKGQMSGRTLLPIPTVAGGLDLDQNYSENKYVLTSSTWDVRVERQQNQLGSPLWQTVSM